MTHRKLHKKLIGILIPAVIILFSYYVLPYLNSSFGRTDTDGLPIKVYFIDVGQGDASLIDVDGKFVMIDGGTIGLKESKADKNKCADIGKGEDNYSYTPTSVIVKGGSFYIISGNSGSRRSPNIVGWKQSENNGWESELPTDGNGLAVYYTTADLSTVYGVDSKVENASLQDVSYGFEDVYTNSQGKIGIYLPAAVSVEATFDGIHYNGKVEAGSNNNVLERDLTTIDYKEELLKNSSQTVVEFAQSKAASEWTSIPAGGAASLTDILDAQADNATEFSLYVRKQGFSEVTEIKIPARPGKPKQVDDVMRLYCSAQL